MPFQKNQHPRLYFSRDDLPALRKQATMGVRSQVLKRIVAWCERYIDPTNEFYFDFRERKRAIWKERESRMIWEPAIDLLSFGYAFTGDERYGAMARDALLNAIETKLADVSYKSMGSDYQGWRRSFIHSHDKGMYAWAVCHAYDLCYDLLSDAQRKLVRDHIVESIHVLDDPQLYINDLRFVTNNRGMRAFVGVHGMYLLAIEGDVEVPRADAYLAEALRAADAYLHSAFDQDGVCYEGPSYAGGVNFVSAFGKMLAQSGRGGLLRNPFWRKYPDSFLYELIPGEGSVNNLNDSPERCGSVQPSLFLMNTPAGAILPWLARQLDLHPSRQTDQPRDLNELIETQFELMFPVWLWEWHEEVPIRTPRELGYPISHCFPQRGIASMRTGWDAGDVLLSHKCGYSMYSQHHQSDDNHIAVYALGERFLVDEGYGEADATQEDGSPAPSRYFSLVDVHNAVMIDGKKPNPLMTNGSLGSIASGHIIDWQHTADFDTSLGDATGSYMLENAVDKAFRRVVFVRNTPHPFAIVIDHIVVDDTGEEHDFEALWRTSKTNRIEVDGTSFQIIGAKNDCHAQVFFPSSPELNVKTHYNAPQLRVKTRAARLEMVIVFTPIRRGETPPSFSCERNGEGDFAVTAKDGAKQWTIRTGTRTEGPLRKPVAIDVRGTA